MFFVIPTLSGKKNPRARRWLRRKEDRTPAESGASGRVPTPGRVTREKGEGGNVLVAQLRRKYEFFAEMTDREILAFLEMSERRLFEEGEEILRRGDSGSDFYLIIFGEVRIRAGDQELSFLDPGECFGEMGALQEKPRSATVIATKPTLLLRVERDALFGEPSVLGGKILTYLVRQLSIKLRRANARFRRRRE
ncbi:MAG: cyclic nucleotide-binding domain-containing protein [bacterium]